MIILHLIPHFPQCICYSNVERVNQKNLCLNNQWAGTLILGGDVNVSIAVKNKWTLRLLLKFRQRQPANNVCWLSRPIITTLSEGSIALMAVSYAKAARYCNRRWEQFFCVKWGFTLSAYRCLFLQSRSFLAKAWDLVAALLAEYKTFYAWVTLEKFDQTQMC